MLVHNVREFNIGMATMVITYSSSEKFRNQAKIKKKFCPDCGNPIARKCKKCPSCGKRFGVFTFGRRLCPSCGRINLARMSNCFQCGYPLLNAPKAIPKVSNSSKGFFPHSLFVLFCFVCFCLFVCLFVWFVLFICLF